MILYSINHHGHSHEQKYHQSGRFTKSPQFNWKKNNKVWLLFIRVNTNYIHFGGLKSIPVCFYPSSPGRSSSCYDNEIVMMNHVYKERFPKASHTLVTLLCDKHQIPEQIPKPTGHFMYSSCHHDDLILSTQNSNIREKMDRIYDWIELKYDWFLYTGIWGHTSEPNAKVQPQGCKPWKTRLSYTSKSWWISTVKGHIS